MKLRRRLDQPDAVDEGAEEARQASRLEPLKQYVETTEAQERRENPAELTHVGQHVTTVLAAAESAANTLREEAEREAQRLREEATHAADDLRNQLAAEVEAERAQARRDVWVAEEEARATRAEADRYAETRRREAEAESARIVQDAERHAAQIATTAEERHESLLADIAASETRLRDLAARLREVATRLEEVAAAGIRTHEAGEAALDRTLVERVTVEPEGVESAT